MLQHVAVHRTSSTSNTLSAPSAQVCCSTSTYVCCSKLQCVAPHHHPTHTLRQVRNLAGGYSGEFKVRTFLQDGTALVEADLAVPGAVLFIGNLSQGSVSPKFLGGCACMRACVHACVRACVCACMHACVRARVRACVRVCVWACLCVGERKREGVRVHVCVKDKV